MYCSHCGKKVNETMLFCPFCGDPIVIPEQDEEASAGAPEPKPVEAAPVVEEPVAQDVTDDGELIAVIAAAIAAFTDSDKQLVVRKVRRVSGWNRAGRAEQVYRF